MIYVYNRVISSFESKIKYHGATYTLENRVRRGDQSFYTFSAPGREGLLIVPYFAEQYLEVERIAKRFAYCKKLETLKIHLRRDLSQSIKAEKMPNQESTTGIMWVLRVPYKDILVEFDYFNEHVSLSRVFQIESNNLFGNGIRVLMEEPEE